MSWSVFKEAFFQSIVNIGEPYFLVPRYSITGATHVQRERVYCYELYHQLRCHLGDQYVYTVHGEIDKSGQQWLRNQLTAYDPALRSDPNPDFVIHQPGHIHFDAQLAAIEVKPTERLNIRNARADIIKLQAFIEAIGYHHAIFLIFGEDRPRLSVSELVNELEINHDTIHVIWHQDVGKTPQILRGIKTW